MSDGPDAAAADRRELHPPTAGDARYVTPTVAVGAAVAAARARAGSTVFVGVDGRGGSGKSTLAARIAAAVPGAAVICCDDFDGPDTAEWDWPRFMAQVATPLLAGRPARYQAWSWGEHHGGAWYEVPPGGTVIVEGVSSTRREVPLPWALTMWVEAPREVRLERALARDGDAMQRQWLDHWMPSEDAYVDREQPQRRVDLLVSGVIEAIGVVPQNDRREALLGTRIVGSWDGPGSAPRVDPAFAGHGIEQILLG